MAVYENREVMTNLLFMEINVHCMSVKALRGNLMPTGRGEPQGQKLLTNVSVVKLKKGGTVWEIATYPNMVLSWRSGVQKDVSEVLQIERVYKNVEKGEFAKAKDLVKAFGTDDQVKIALEIMAKGELNLSDKERSSQQELILKEICSVVVEKCINPETKRPVTIGAVERALADLHFNPTLNKPAKAQALEAIKMLEGKYPIQRAPMSLKLSFPAAAKDEVRVRVVALGAAVEAEDVRGDLFVIVCHIPPDRFRDTDALVREYSKEGGAMEVMQLSAVSGHRGDAESKPASPQPAPAPPVLAAVRAPVDGASGGIKSATAPGEVFATRQELAAHMKSDWHKRNLSLKSEGKPMLSKAEFQDYQLMME
ncbi:SBDS protein C-terminal domain-containing protein [Baffinella frigidus]|nr:SBDS protein C-terminal domain-containing protein [Cryptophyta sp. CCMP2293]